MTTEATPGALGSNDQLGLAPDRASFEAWAAAFPQYRFWNTTDAAYAAWCHGVADERARWMSVACSGWRVLQRLDEHAQKRTSHQNVRDALDALVLVMKA